MELLRARTGKVMIEAHMEDSYQSAEAAWSSIEALAKSGIDLLEVNVHRAADGTLVIHHSHKLPDGRWIRDLKHTELEAVASNCSVLFLQEMLEWSLHKHVALSLDIKNSFGLDTAIFYDTVSMTENSKMVEDVVLLSWDHAGLFLAKEMNPRIATRASIRCRPIDIVNLAKAARVDAVGLSVDLMTKGQVESLHQAGIAIATLLHPDFLWTVDLGQDIISCLDLEDIEKALHYTRDIS